MLYLQYCNFRNNMYMIYTTFLVSTTSILWKIPIKFYQQRGMCAT